MVPVQPAGSRPAAARLAVLAAAGPPLEARGRGRRGAEPGSLQEAAPGNARHDRPARLPR